MQSIGNRIRKLRRSKKLTIADLAKSIDVSISLISQVERDEISPSLATLRKIANFFNVSITEFFDDNEPLDHKSVIDEKDIVVRKEYRKKLSIPGAKAKYELLTPNLQRNIEFLSIEVEPNLEKEEIIKLSHPGEECALVLEGELVVILGDREFILGPGDSISYDSGIPHSIENRTNRKTIIVTAITPPNF